MTGAISRKALERAKTLSRLTPEERARRKAEGDLKVSLWMIPTGIVLTGIIVVAWWSAQANFTEASPVPRRFAHGDVFPWYAIVPVNLYVVGQLIWSWLRWRKVCGPGAGTSPPPPQSGPPGPR